LRKGLLDFDRRQAWRGPEAYIDLPPTPSRWTSALPKPWKTTPTATPCALPWSPTLEPKRVLATLQSGEQLEIGPEGLKAVGKALTDKPAPSSRSAAAL
jgi:penicillin-binding protein 1A